MNFPVNNGGQAPQMPMQPQAQAPAGDMAGLERSGLQKVQNTEFNQNIQNILLSRIEEEGQKNPNFGQAIDAGVSREAALELALILPELHPVFRAMGVLDGGPMGGAPIGQQKPMASVEGENAPDDAAMEDEEEETDNPLVSRGLMG